MRKTHATLSLALLLVLSTISTAASAVDEKEAAAKHFEKGVSLFKNEDYAAALIEFEAAYEAKPHFAVRYNLAICLYKLHRYAEAANQIQRYLSEGGDEVPPEKRLEVESILEEMEALVGSVEVDCNVPDADVYVDGEFADKANSLFPIQLNVGEYEIEVRAEGYEPLTTTVKLPGGQTKLLKVQLKQEGTEDAGPVEPGEKGKKKPVPVAAFGAMAGLTVALAITASVTGGVALKKEKEYADLSAGDDWADAQKSGRNLVIATDVLWGITGATAVATIVMAFFTEFKKEKSDVAFVELVPNVLEPGLVVKGVF